MDTRPPDPAGDHGPGPPTPPAEGARTTPRQDECGPEQHGPPNVASRSGPHQCENRSAPHLPATPVTTPSDAREHEGDVRCISEATGDNGANRPREAETGVGTGGVSYAEAVRQPSSSVKEATELPVISKVAGNWTPRERSALLETLAKNWAEPQTPVVAEELKGLMKIAMAPTDIRYDDALRERTELETHALLAYLNGSLELPHAPNFLKATMPLLQRVMIEQFHETHVESALTADIRPAAKLRRSMTHIALFRLLYQANCDSERGRLMIKSLMNDAKMLHFDGVHTLTVVFHSRRVAQAYEGVALRLQGTFLELADTEGGAGARVLRPTQLRRQYSIRVHQAEAIGLVTLAATLGNLPGVTILDVERPRVDSTEIVDNRYVTIHFQGNDCPAELRGVTKILLAGLQITVHHHLIHPRLPCARCFAPHHTTGFCRANPNQMLRAQRKFQRVYEGAVPHYEVGTAVQYKHSDRDSLVTFMTTLQREIEAEMAKAHDAGIKTFLKSAGDEDATATTTNETGAAPSEETAPTTEVALQTRSDGMARDEGFQVAQSKSARTRAAGNKKKKEAAAKVPAADKAPHARPGSSASLKAATDKYESQRKKKPQHGRGPGPKPQGFTSFNRARAQGRYAELAESSPDSDSDADADCSQDEAQEEAPYAYAQDKMARKVEVAPAVTDKTTRQSEAATGAPPAEPGAAMDIDSDVGSSVSGYVGSSGPSQTESYASTPGSEFPFSLASDSEKTRDQCTADSATTQPEGPYQVRGEDLGHEDTGDDTMRADTVTEDSSRDLSQDGFVMGRTQYPAGMPQQLPTFIGPFGGSLIHVPENGQCAYAALYATTSYVEGGALQFTSEVVRNANAIKRSVYTLMMANLAADVECGILDPGRELERLYPKQPSPADAAAASAMLYGHYAQERARSVNTQIPSDFWAGAEVLRAMAQYLREPLFVLDVDAHNDAHVQRYYYKNYDTDNGGVHESGCGGAMEDSKALEMLRHFARLHVLPVMLVIKRHEGHFYGVHHGELATRWQAEGDRQFADANCTTHPWYDEIITHMAYSEPRMAQTDLMDCSDETDLILIGGMEPRTRLDVVHDRLGLLRLDAEGFDMEAMEDGLHGEGDRLQQEAGPIPHLTEPRTAGLTRQHAESAERRYPITTQGRAAMEPVRRILDSIGLEPELLADRAKLRQLLQVNAAALNDWRRHTDSGRGMPKTQDVGHGIAGMMPWLMTHRAALHVLFRHLPYPELAAKQLSQKILQQWGALEAYDVMVETLREVMHASSSSAKTSEFCRAWIAACTIRAGDGQDRTVAGDRQKWARLQQLCPQLDHCVRPEGMSTERWNILNVLPHTLWAWKATPLGQVQRAQLGHHYHGQPAIQRLCDSVEARAEWGTAVDLPSGLTWDDRLTAMEAGLSAQLRY